MFKQFCLSHIYSLSFEYAKNNSFVYCILQVIIFATGEHSKCIEMTVLFV